MMNKVVYIM